MMTERNQEICKLYVGGLTLQECGDRFGISRQRVKQILQEGGVWRARIEKPLSDRDEFLGVNISESVKVKLRQAAEDQGTSMSALAAKFIEDKLEPVQSQTE